MGLLDQMILVGHLSEGISGIWKQMEEDRVWNVWLHKWTKKSWSEFRSELIPNPSAPVRKTTTDIKSIISHSRSVVGSISPEA